MYQYISFCTPLIHNSSTHNKGILSLAVLYFHFIVRRKKKKIIKSNSDKGHVIEIYKSNKISTYTFK